MVIMGEDLTISLINREFEKLTGYTKKEVEGKKSWSELIVKEEQGMLRELHGFMRTEPDRVKLNYETRLIGRNGNVRNVFVTAGMIMGTKESTASIFDITEKKAAQKYLKESESKFRLLVENLPNTVSYIAALDGSSTTLYVSPQIRRILGYTPEEYNENQDIWVECLHPDDKERILAEVAHCRKTKVPFVSEYRMITKDGREIWVSDEAFVVKDNRDLSLFLIGVNRDITKRKQAEIDLVSKNQKLEEMNIALNVILSKREEYKHEIEEKILTNIREMIAPYIIKLKKNGLDAQQNILIEIIESNLREISSSFACTLSSPFFKLTPKEINVANLLRLGRSTKEICDLLVSTDKAVAFHRGNIRRKLGLQKKKITLRSYLMGEIQ